MPSPKETWTQLVPHRQSLEKMWKDCSALTLPYLFPEEQVSESKALPTPYSSIGASSVNTLASKLLLALLPPTGNFFRLMPYTEQTANLNPQQLKDLDKALVGLENDVNEYINVQAMRVPLYEALKLLIVVGNSLVYKVPGGGLKVFNPYQYVVRRDYAGNVLDIVIKETIAPEALPKNTFDKLVEKKKANEDLPKEVELYTQIERVSVDKWKLTQEAGGILVEEAINYTSDTMPYIPLRWTSVFNSDYGRGLVEQYIGDLRSLEGLSQMIVEAAGSSAKVLFGLRPASTTSLDDLQNAVNGDFILGDLEKDVTVLHINKSADLQVPFSLMGQLEARISRAFLNFQGSIRDSERTTAAEARMTANELESTLGGTYSVLAQELQLPMLRLILQEIEPKVLKITKPSIVTGLSAISRERDFQNYNTMLQTVAQLGPEAVQRYFKVEAYLSNIATSLGLPSGELIKTPEELQAEQQQLMAMQQQANLMEGGQPNANVR